MNQGQSRQRMKTSSLRNTITTIITITTMLGAGMHPASSWRLGSVTIITTTIIITTASTAIESRADRMTENRTFGSCFFGS
jgi:hypothetical protein